MNIKRLLIATLTSIGLFTVLSHMGNRFVLENLYSSVIQLDFNSASNHKLMYRATIFLSILLATFCAIGFEINIESTVKKDHKSVYQQFLNVGEWWSADHTYFGQSKNLSIEAKAGGCFCEVSGTKEVLHMTVSFVDPGKEIRMIGGLGPLQMLGIHGGMSWQFIPVNDNETKIIHHYQVVGFKKDGFEKLAPIVNKVQTLQVSSLVEKIENN